MNLRLYASAGEPWRQFNNQVRHVGNREGLAAMQMLYNDDPEVRNALDINTRLAEALQGVSPRGSARYRQAAGAKCSWFENCHMCVNVAATEPSLCGESARTAEATIQRAHLRDNGSATVSRILSLRCPVLNATASGKTYVS